MTTTGRGPDRHPERILRYRHNGRMSSPTRRRPPTAQVAVALLTVYIVWGSTYLAIAIMIESMPPLLSAGVRFVIAGLILMVVVHLHARITRAGPVERPTRAHWVTAIIVGTFLLLGGNGGVVLAELTVPSGVVAVIIATTPIWLAVFDSIVTRRRPSRLVVGGLVAGLVGVAILLAPVAGLESLDTRGVLLALGAEIAWATGSIYSRSAPHPASGTLSSGMSMLGGGIALLLGGLLLGELGRVEFAEFTARSLIAFVYLVIFGSLAGYTAYLWLLANDTRRRGEHICLREPDRGRRSGCADPVRADHATNAHRRDHHHRRGHRHGERASARGRGVRAVAGSGWIGYPRGHMTTSVGCEATETGWRCAVRTGEDPNATEHVVTVDRGTREELAPGSSVEELVAASFAFLLEREPGNRSCGSSICR